MKNYNFLEYSKISEIKFSTKYFFYLINQKKSKKNQKNKKTNYWLIKNMQILRYSIRKCKIQIIIFEFSNLVLAKQEKRLKLSQIYGYDI